MKKLLGATLALAMIAPASANAAELLKNLSISGQLDVDAVSANNVTDFRTSHYDGVSSVQTRLMLHADWDVNDDVHARISIDKNNRTWGSASENLNTVQSNLLVDEANVKIKQLFGALDTTVGRQYYGEKGDAVIYFGPKDNLYGLPISALDAVRFDWSGAVGVTLLGAKVAGTGLTPPDTGSVNLYGVNVTAKSGDNLSGSVYLYDRTTTNSSAANGVQPDDILYVAGVRGKYTAGGVTVKAEFDKDFGQNRPAGFTATAGDTNYTGWAFLADVNAKQDLSAGALQEFVSLGVGSGGNNTSKWFQGIASDYRPGDIWGRFFAPNGGGVTQFGTNIGGAGDANNTGSIGGLNILGIGAKITPASVNKLTVGVSAYQYRFHDADSANLVTVGKAVSSRELGTEYDLDANWQQNENTSVTVGVGDFQTANAIKTTLNAGQNSSARMAYADLKLKFGGNN